MDEFIDLILLQTHRCMQMCTHTYTVNTYAYINIHMKNIFDYRFIYFICTEYMHTAYMFVKRWDGSERWVAGPEHTLDVFSCLKGRGVVLEAITFAS